MDVKGFLCKESHDQEAPDTLVHVDSLWFVGTSKGTHTGEGCRTFLNANLFWSG